jgi:hypothetical protein
LQFAESPLNQEEASDAPGIPLSEMSQQAPVSLNTLAQRLLFYKGTGESRRTMRLFLQKFLGSFRFLPPEPRLSVTFAA